MLPFKKFVSSACREHTPFTNLVLFRVLQAEFTPKHVPGRVFFSMFCTIESRNVTLSPPR